MLISVSSKSAEQVAISSPTPHEQQHVSDAPAEAISPDDREPISGVETADERYLLAWQQVLHDDLNTEDHYDAIRSFCSRGAWADLGYQTFDGFCCERLGIDKNAITDLLVRRFGKARVRLLTVAMPRQGTRNDLDPTSRKDGEKFGLRKDSTTRAALAAIERAPAIERLIVDGLLSFECAAKLGNRNFSEAQIARVKDLGAQVGELLRLDPAEAKKLIRREVEAVVEKPKSPAAQLAERLRKLPLDDLREALALVPLDVLRQVVPAEVFMVEPQEALPSSTPPLIMQGDADASDRGGSHQTDINASDDAETRHFPSDTDQTPSLSVCDVTMNPNGDTTADRLPLGVASKGENQDQSGSERADSVRVEGIVRTNERRDPHVLILANLPRQGPNWELIDNATTRPLDIQIGDLSANTPGVMRLSSLSFHSFKGVLGEDGALFRAKSLKHWAASINSAASSSNMRVLADGEAAPAGATVVFVYLDEAGRVCKNVGFGRTTIDGRFPDELVFVSGETISGLIVLRGPRTGSFWGKKTAIVVHCPDNAPMVAAAE